MSEKVLNWGIFGAGKISNDFACAFTALPKSQFKLLGVAARSKESADNFAKTYGIPIAHGSYEELAQNKDIDVIYIGTVHINHLELCKIALNNGKHVLCEKPLCMDLQETQELVDLSRKKKLFLMEGIWSRFFPLYNRLRELLKSDTIGDISHVNVNFGFPLKQIEYVAKKEFGGGGMYGIGLYATQFVSLVYGGIKPLKVVAAGHLLSAEGVDENISTILVYPAGKLATISVSIKTILSNDATIFGTKGNITVDAFWSPSTLKYEIKQGSWGEHSEKKVEEFPLPEIDPSLKLNFPNSQGLSYQCHEVRKCILKGDIESSLLPHDEILLIAEINESIRKQVGYTYSK